MKDSKPVVVDKPVAVDKPAEELEDLTVPQEAAKGVAGGGEKIFKTGIKRDS